MAIALLAGATAVTPATGGRPQLHGGAFFSNCRFSHTARDDPIVFPSRPGYSHAHAFFGNVSTNAHSSPASLRAAATTCRLRADTAAYWIPTLYKGEREIRPAKAQFYYVMRGYDHMRVFPFGLKVVAGDPHAASPQRRRVVYWACGAGGGVRSAPSADVPTCKPVTTRFQGRPRTENALLELHVNFPDCWDGRRLDSPDHQSHMTHSTNYVCPRSHPVKVPLIRLNVQYPITGGRDVHLSSGGRFSGHADFFNAWNQAALTRLVNECFHDRCNAAFTAARRG